MLRHRPENDDPLSDVLTLLRPQRQGSGVLNFGGDWRITFSADCGIRCYAVARGTCWVTTEALGEPVQVIADEIMLLAGNRPFRISSASNSDQLAEAEPALFRQDRILTVNNGGGCVLIGAHFQLDDAHERLLLSALPPLVVVREPGQRETLGSILRGLWHELETPQPGGRLAVEHLNQMLLIFALRLFIRSEVQRPVGWLSALADQRVARSLAAIHGKPERPWTLKALATEASMSRTAFASTFKFLLGVTPMAYLTKWRMMTAAHRLQVLRTPVAEVALAVGYGSATSFSTAFRKAYGVAPSDYARFRTDLPERIKIASSSGK